VATPIKKKLLDPAAAPYLGYCQNRLLQLDRVRRQTGLVKMKKIVSIAGFFALLECTDASRNITLWSQGYQLFQLRAYHWPWYADDMLLVAMNGVNRLGRKPRSGVSGDDYLTWNQWILTYSASELQSYSCAADYCHRLYTTRDNWVSTTLGGARVLIMTRGAPATETVPLGPYDLMTVTQDGNSFNYAVVAFEIPGDPGADPPYASKVGGTVGGVTVRAMPITRGYTAKDGNAGGCAANADGWHVYYREQDTTGTWHPYLLTFNNNLNLTRQLTLPVDLQVHKMRGKSDAGTFEIRCGSNDIFLLGVNAAGTSNYLVRVDGTGTITTRSWAVGDDKITDLAIGTENVFLLTQYKHPEADRSYTDNIPVADGYPISGDRYAYKYTVKISRMPFDLSSVVDDELHSESRYSCNEHGLYHYPSIAVDRVAEGNLYFAYAEGYFHCYPDYPVPPWTLAQLETFPYTSTTANHQFAVKIKSFKIGRTSLVLQKTDATTGDYGPYFWPGGVIGDRHYGLIMGKI
jgi:hypothetical protein